MLSIVPELVVFRSSTLFNVCSVRAIVPLRALPLPHIYFLDGVTHDP
jgi:hypothetical protein